jgi:hypothetical protein
MPNKRHSEKLFQRLEHTRVEMAGDVIKGLTNEDPTDSFSNLYVRVKEIDGDFVQTESHMMNYNMHPLLMFHSMLMELQKTIEKSTALSGKLDIALVIKVPEDLKDYGLGPEVVVKMGEDLGVLDKALSNRIVNAILTNKVDALILKTFIQSEKEDVIKKRKQEKKKTTKQVRKKQDRKKK